MNCDNQTVIGKVESSKDNEKSSRHAKRRLNFVRKLRNSGVINVTYISIDKNVLDPFIKGLPCNVKDITQRDGYETLISCHGGNQVYVAGDPVN
jgi:hypothetical protein